MGNKLVPLRVPSTWAVIHNSFGTEAPIIKDGTIINDEFFNEDLLSIERLKFDGKRWTTTPGDYIVDLGWYPDGDPEGSYRLTLLRGKWDHIIVTFESRDRKKICGVIETCLELATSDIAEEEIIRLLEMFYRS